MQLLSSKELQMLPTVFILVKSLAVGYHHAHLEDRETEAQRQEVACPGPPTPPVGEQQAQARRPLPPICLAHALSISLIRTIDLFILSG